VRGHHAQGAPADAAACPTRYRVCRVLGHWEGPRPSFPSPPRPLLIPLPLPMPACPRTAMAAMAGSRAGVSPPLQALLYPFSTRADRVSAFLTPRRTSRGPRRAGSASAVSCRRSVDRRVTGHRGQTSSGHRGVSHRLPMGAREVGLLHRLIPTADGDLTGRNRLGLSSPVFAGRAELGQTPTTPGRAVNHRGCR
jgi:hypothetical protein